MTENLIVIEKLEKKLESDYGVKADSFIHAATPANTKRAYVGDIKYFTKWITCAVSPEGVWPVSEDIVIKFIFHHLDEMPVNVENALIAGGWKRGPGKHSLNTVKRRLVSLSIMHSMNGQPDPCESPRVKALIAAMSKTPEGVNKAKAITKEILERMILTCGDSLIDTRDKALLLFGFASGGRRRSEIADAIIENLDKSGVNFIYRINKSKTDQLGKGHDVPVKGSAAKALTKWLDAAKISGGRLFRAVSKGGKIGEKITDVDINRVVKKRAKMAGYDSTQFSAHSLRRGFMTESGIQGCTIADAMALSGHKSVNIALGYYESGSVINNKAGDLI
jgi:integrase